MILCARDDAMVRREREREREFTTAQLMRRRIFSMRSRAINKYMKVSRPIGKSFPIELEVNKTARRVISGC